MHEGKLFGFLFPEPLTGHDVHASDVSHYQQPRCLSHGWYLRFDGNALILQVWQRHGNDGRARIMLRAVLGEHADVAVRPQDAIDDAL